MGALAKHPARAGRLVPFGLHPFAQHFVIAARGFFALPQAFCRGFLEKTSRFHFAVDPFTLHFFLQHALGLFYIIIADAHFHRQVLSKEE